MKPAIHKVIVVMLLGALVTPLTGNAEPPLTLVAAINTAGLQRMLTQRIGKAYSQIGIGANPESSHQELQESVASFDENLAALEEFASSLQQLQKSITSFDRTLVEPKEYTTTQSVIIALKQVRNLWTPVRAVATGSVNLYGAKLVAYWNDDLLHATHKVTQLLQDVSNDPPARLVNISGRLRMLSQRMAKLYMLQVWGINTLTVQDELEAARNSFTRSFAILLATPENTDAIQHRLDVVARDWMWFRKAMNMVDTDPFPETVANVSETILVNMHEITRMYEELADKDQQRRSNDVTRN